MFSEPLIAVTGASGFVGSAIVRALRSAGRRFVAFGTPDAAAGPDESWERVDLTDREATRKSLRRHRPDAMIHAAWVRPSGGGLWHMEENFAWRDLSRDLFKVFWGEGGHQVVACGTCAEYAPTEADCREDTTPIAPDSLYGQAKAELHELAARDGAKAGGTLCWARLFYLYGPGEARSRLVPSVIGSLLANEPARTASGRAVRDFALVDDIAAGIVALVTAQARGAFNVASGAGIAQHSLVERIGDLMDRRDLLHIGALPDRPGEPPRIVADVARIAQATGWSARTSLDEGLRRTIEWWRATDRGVG